MRRSRISRTRSRRAFRRFLKSRKVNHRVRVMRGGFRI